MLAAECGSDSAKFPCVGSRPSCRSNSARAKSLLSAPAGDSHEGGISPLLMFKESCSSACCSCCCSCCCCCCCCCWAVGELAREGDAEVVGFDCVLPLPLALSRGAWLMVVSIGGGRLCLHQSSLHLLWSQRPIHSQPLRYCPVAVKHEALRPTPGRL
jgi:hypothetical protein